jgi:hypothetical protein
VSRTAYTRQTRGHHNGRGRLGVVLYECYEPCATHAANERDSNLAMRTPSAVDSSAIGKAIERV